MKNGLRLAQYCAESEVRLRALTENRASCSDAVAHAHKEEFPGDNIQKINQSIKAAKVAISCLLTLSVV